MHATIWRSVAIKAERGGWASGQAASVPTGNQTRMSIDPSGRPDGPRSTSRTVEHPRVLAVTGDLDARASRRLRARIAEEIAKEIAEETTGSGDDLIVDLSGVRTLSSPGVTALLELTERMSRQGRRLRLVTGTSDVLRVLRSRQATDLLEAYDTMEAAVGAVAGRTPAEGASTEEQIRRLHDELDALRAKLRTRPVIARALGMLQERYRLPDMDAAFRLLRDGSQRGNVKMHTLADALVQLPRPADRSDRYGRSGAAGDRWPPAELRAAEPELSFVPARRRTGDARSAVLSALLDAALACTRSRIGDVRLVRDDGELWPTRRQGLTREFAESLAGVAEAVPARALRSGARVVVPDVATDPVFAGTASRESHLAEGLRAIQSTPLVDGDGDCVGIVSTYHGEAGHVPTAAECAELDRIGAETGRWLTWHRSDRVFAALEDLHRDATSR